MSESHTPPPPRILLTGATGFIGGTVLTQLLNSTSAAIRSSPITCLVRGADRATKLRDVYGNRVSPVVYRDLDDLKTTTATASRHDIVISTTLGYHSPSALALLTGLSQRQKTHPQNDIWFIHTSGASNIGGRPITQSWVDDASPSGREFDDERDDVYAYEVDREAKQPYIQRSTELSVVDGGVELGVKTLVLMAPMIYGVGTGLFNRRSVQIPAYIYTALDNGQGVVIGEGVGEIDHVHVRDLAELYEILAVKMLQGEGEEVPTGKKGIIFSSNGHDSWVNIAKQVADACHAAGVLNTADIKHVGLPEGARLFTQSYLGGEADEMMIELGLASNVRTVPSVARRLGWKPTRGEEDWKRGFADDVAAVLQERSKR
ncbi:NAD dependent epimerase/dehydratase family protein-like protein [Xylariaceae sp. FL1272]|nr:NAD dependent epimerase/dehydratase family protein-like protein [Xylariaceae sp. FL1272]